MGKSQSLELKLKSCDPQLKKYILELEAVITKLDLENSRLRIDKKRLNALVNSLESELAKYTPMTPEQAEAFEKKVSEALKILEKKNHKNSHNSK